MKKLIILFTIIVICSGCSKNKLAVAFGGTMTIVLPKGEKLMSATWRGDNLYYLTEPMPKEYKPKTKIFREKSSFGIAESVIKFKETK